MKLLWKKHPGRGGNKIHAQIGSFWLSEGLSACGIFFGKSERMTEEGEPVTCKRCLHIIGRSGINDNHTHHNRMAGTA